jgi:transposase
MSSKRRRFTPEFRAEAVRLVTETGRPIAHVAAEIGIGAQLLGRWVHQSQPAAEPAPGVGPLDLNERAELERLRKENADLRLDRSFLKKAAVFFASDQNR